MEEIGRKIYRQFDSRWRKTDSEADREIHTYYNAVDVDIVIKLNRQTGRWIGEQTDSWTNGQTDGQTVWYTE